jgi:UDP-N-acetyl-2-amino-2-deoxyglucuronate dehydrogenase
MDAMQTPKRFAITGVAGYIAPRHLKAIKDTGNVLVAACDPHDSVGIIDRYFFEASYFREFERLDRHAEKLRRKGEPIDYVSVCSPNYLHDAHIRFGLRIGAHALCEKPLVLNPWNIDPLLELAEEHKRRIYTVLQLRVHPVIKALHESVVAERPGRRRDIELTYVTSRGRWYLASWKGNAEQSGGLTTNIGIHFFDMLIWIFGAVEKNEVHVSQPTRAAGVLELAGARVKWFLSIDPADLPQSAAAAGKTTFRSISVDGQELEFSEGFTDLHTEVYREMLAGRGFTAEDARASIEAAHTIRTATPLGVRPESHPMLKQ